MTTFDQRKDAFENRFAHDEELRFKATARRNKLLGLWAAEKLGKSGADADAYAKSVVVADFEEAGDEDVVRKVRGDFATAARRRRRGGDAARDDGAADPGGRGGPGRPLSAARGPIVARTQIASETGAWAPVCFPGALRSNVATPPLQERALSRMNAPCPTRHAHADRQADRPRLARRRAWPRATTILSAWCGIADPVISGMLAQEAFDAVTLDMQHGPITLGEVIRAIPLINAAGKPALGAHPGRRVPERLEAVRFRRLGRDRADDQHHGRCARLRRLVQISADGRAQLGQLWRARARRGSTRTPICCEANGFSMTFAMIETREAMAILDDILALPGIDAVFVGPSDLSIALSGGKRVDATAPEVDDAIGHIVARASAVNKPVAVYAQSPERAKDFYRLGAKMVTLMSDTVMLRTGAQAAIRSVRG